MSGWGSQHVNSPEMFPLNELRRVFLPLIDNEVCLERFPGLITDNHICAAADIGSPCQGDYGGPLTVPDPDGGTTQYGDNGFAMDKNKRLVLSVAVILAVFGSIKAEATQNARIVNLQIAPELADFEPRDFPSGRITGGNLVGPEDVPYAVGIINQVPAGTRWCGGSLISANYVLTAASCFSLDSSSATVLLGASNMTDVTDLVPATTLIIHIGHDPIENLNDIALLRLARPVNFGPFVRPVRLPNWRQVFTPFTNQLGTISGWGALWQNAPEIFPLNDLRRVNVLVISNPTCMLRFPGSITESHLCVSTDMGSPCQGDQGGPLTVSDPDGGTTQIGIFSFLSMLGCNSNWPAVFTRLTPYLQWIETNTDVVIRDDFEY
ncbi:hypothetical protein quinque_005425 [Culex quinquefasciatus]